MNERIEGKCLYFKPNWRLKGQILMNKPATERTLEHFLYLWQLVVIIFHKILIFCQFEHNLLLLNDISHNVSYSIYCVRWIFRSVALTSQKSEPYWRSLQPELGSKLKTQSWKQNHSPDADFQNEASERGTSKWQHVRYLTGIYWMKCSAEWL